MVQPSKPLALQHVEVAAHEGPHAMSSWRLTTWADAQSCLVRLKTWLPEGDCWKMSARIAWEQDLEYDFQFELPSEPFNLLSEVRIELERLAGRSCPPGMDKRTYQELSRNRLQPFFHKLLDQCDWGPDYRRKKWGFLIDQEVNRPIMEGDPDLLLVKDKMLKEAAAHPEMQATFKELGIPSVAIRTTLLSGWFLPEEIQEIRDCPEKALECINKMHLQNSEPSLGV